jgi:hypothetical protein
MFKNIMRYYILFMLGLFMLPLSAVGAPVVRAFVFLSPGCSSCEVAKEHSITAVAKKAGCQVELKYFDIDNLPDYKKLVEVEKKLKDTGNEMPVIVCGSKVLGGEKEITTGLEPTLKKYARSGTDWPDTAESTAPKLSARQPKVHLSSTLANAGTMLPGSEKHITVILKNTGDSVLKVTGLRSACPCYKPAASKKSLTPGEQADIRVHIKAAGMSGRIEKFVMVDTNDPITPTSRIKVTVNIPSIITATPTRISFGSIQLGKAIDKELAVTTIAAGLRVQSTSSVIKVMSTTRRGHKYIVKVRIEGKSAGRLLGRINLISSKPDCKSDVLVFGNVTP